MVTLRIKCNTKTQRNVDMHWNAKTCSAMPKCNVMQNNNAHRYNARSLLTSLNCIELNVTKLPVIVIFVTPITKLNKNPG